MFDLISICQVKEAHFRAYPHWKWCTKDRKKSPRKVSDRTESSDSMGMCLRNASVKKFSNFDSGLELYFFLAFHIDVKLPIFYIFLTFLMVGICL